MDEGLVGSRSDVRTGVGMCVMCGMTTLVVGMALGMVE